MIADDTGRGTEPARGLAARLRDAAAAADRLAEFSFSEGAPPGEPTLADGEELATARDFVLRAVRGAADPIGFRVLQAAAAGVRADELAAGLGLTRLALLERVHELLQLGLVARDLETDRVHATPAGVALVALLEDLAADTAEWLAKRRRA